MQASAAQPHHMAEQALQYAYGTAYTHQRTLQLHCGPTHPRIAEELLALLL
jgi:hypothetical protein